MKKRAAIIRQKDDLNSVMFITEWVAHRKEKFSFFEKLSKDALLAATKKPCIWKGGIGEFGKANKERI